MHWRDMVPFVVGGLILAAATTQHIVRVCRDTGRPVPWGRLVPLMLMVIGIATAFGGWFALVHKP